MIQRIQTIYLFLASISLALLFFFPIYHYSETQADQTVKEMKLTIQGKFEKIPETGNYVIKDPTYGKSLMVLVVGIAFMFAIFKYNNRKVQLRITRIMIILTFIITVFLLTGASEIVNNPLVSNVKPGYAVIFPSVAIVMAALSARAIRKDEELIQSADRLR